MFTRHKSKLVLKRARRIITEKSTYSETLSSGSIKTQYCRMGNVLFTFFPPFVFQSVFSFHSFIYFTEEFFFQRFPPGSGTAALHVFSDAMHISIFHFLRTGCEAFDVAEQCGRNCFRESKNCETPEIYRFDCQQ